MGFRRSRILPGRPKKVPSYCLHKGTGQAVVRINGRDFYLGKYGSAKSHEAYQRIVAAHLADVHGNCGVACAAPAVVPSRSADLTVVELVEEYWKFARGYYVKNGKPTNTQHSIRAALRPVIELFGEWLASDFGPLALKKVQQTMAEQDWSRGYINDNTSRIKAMFKWAVSEERVPETVYRALLTVSGLKKGRCPNVREPPPVRPVPDAHIDAVLPLVVPQVRAMIQVQLLTGMRPGEVVLLRACDIDTSSSEWVYTPGSHKNEHHDVERFVLFGPKAQEVLRPWLVKPPDAYLFDPKEAAAAFYAARKGEQYTIGQNGVRRRPRRNGPGDHYTEAAYRRAIQRACLRAGVPRWKPNQLRHNAGTLLKRNFGWEAAKAVLGHQSLTMTQVYAENDLALSAKIMRVVG
jgi:integrase